MGCDQFQISNCTDWESTEASPVYLCVHLAESNQESIIHQQLLAVIASPWPYCFIGSLLHSAANSLWLLVLGLFLYFVFSIFQPHLSHLLIQAVYVPNNPCPLPAACPARWIHEDAAALRWSPSRNVRTFPSLKNIQHDLKPNCETFWGSSPVLHKHIHSNIEGVYELLWSMWIVRLLLPSWWQ